MPFYFGVVNVLNVQGSGAAINKAIIDASNEVAVDPDAVHIAGTAVGRQ